MHRYLIIFSSNKAGLGRTSGGCYKDYMIIYVQMLSIVHESMYNINIAINIVKALKRKLIVIIVRNLK